AQQRHGLGGGEAGEQYRDGDIAGVGVAVDRTGRTGHEDVARDGRIQCSGGAQGDARRAGDDLPWAFGGDVLEVECRRAEEVPARGQYFVGGDDVERIEAVEQDELRTRLWHEDP